MKSKIEVRKFAIEKALLIMGNGAPSKDIVNKAKEIEAYVIGEAELPETYDESLALTDAIGSVLTSAGAVEKAKK